MDEEPKAARSGPLGTGRQVLDDAYVRADRAIDRGQFHAFRVLWFFLPETSIAKDARFQQILASRFFSDAGQQALLYGALIAVVRGGGGSFQVALIGVAALVPAALLGLYGGAVADALPKRVALAAVYNAQAALCFVVPAVFGTHLGAAMFLVFAVSALGQVSGPTESSVLPLVASDAQLSSAASLVSLASNVGTAFGTALLTPVLVRLFGVSTVFYVAGVLLVIAASRVFDLSAGQEPRKLDWRRPNVRLRSTPGIPGTRFRAPEHAQERRRRCAPDRARRGGVAVRRGTRAGGIAAGAAGRRCGAGAPELRLQRTRAGQPTGRALDLLDRVGGASDCAGRGPCVRSPARVVSETRS